MISVLWARVIFFSIFRSRGFQLVCNRDDKKHFENVLTVDSNDDVVTMFASVPLNDHENWRPLAQGEVIAVSRGHIISSQEAPSPR